MAKLFANSGDPECPQISKTLIHNLFCLNFAFYAVVSQKA